MGGARAHGIAISLDGRPLYICLIGRGAVVPVSTSAYHMSTPVKVGILPATMTITPNGKTLYVGDWDSGTVTPINTATGTVGTAIIVHGLPSAMAVTHQRPLAVVMTAARPVVRYPR